MNVDEDSLAKLRCANCCLLLSVGPITAHWENGFICGRCSDKGEPNTIYEVFAQKFLFPCRYQQYGCKESLKWGTVGSHEENCARKPLSCPASPSCSWAGSIVQIASHFQEKHGDDIMDVSGEIKLIEDFQHRKFIKTGNGEYIFRLYFSRFRKLLEYSVVQLAGVKECEKQTYRLKLYTANQSTKITLAGQTTPYDNNLSQMDNTLDINAIHFLANNAPVLLQFKFCLSGEKRQNNFEFLKLLECPICNERMAPPIHQCVTGHSFCYSCYTNLKNCALCKREFTNLTRNFALEDLANQIFQSCKNSSLGCTYNGMIEDVNNHQKSCHFLKCPLEVSHNCKWSGEFRYLSAHCKSNHQWLEAKSYGCTSSLQKLAIQLVHSAGMFFRLCNKYENNQFFVVVQFIGPSNEAAAYSFEFSFAFVNHPKVKLTMRDTCQPYSNDDDIFRNSIKFSSPLLSCFVKDNVFQYDIKIKKK